MRGIWHDCVSPHPSRRRGGPTCGLKPALPMLHYGRIVSPLRGAQCDSLRVQWCPVSAPLGGGSLGQQERHSRRRRNRGGRIGRGLLVASRQGRVRRRLPGAGRMDRAPRLRERQGRLGGLPPLLHEPRPERARPAPGLPSQRRRLPNRAADAQRRRRQHHTLERPLPALPPLGLQGEVARRRCRRLPDDLLGPGAVLRRERPDQRRRRYDGRPGLPGQVGASDPSHPPRQGG